MLSRIVNDCQRLPEIARGSKWLSEVVNGCQRLSKAFRDFLLKIDKGSQRLRQVVRDCYDGQRCFNIIRDCLRLSEAVC